MLLLKTRAEHVNGVLDTGKHATHYLPAADPGDYVLIAVTRSTLPKGQKAIQWIARLKEVYQDHQRESIRIWGRHWKYIIELEGIREVPPFNLEEIQVSSYNYGPVRTHCRLLPDDERAVLEHLRAHGFQV